MNGTEQSAAFGGAPWDIQLGRFSVACTMVTTHIYVGCTIKKNIKKGDLDVLIQHNQWESTVSCYVHTHMYNINIYIYTPYIVRIQRFTATIFMHVCTKNYRSCYTHISTPSLLYACAIRLWKTSAVERQETKSVRVL